MSPDVGPQGPPQELVIQGLTQTGERFRPSDWGEDRHLSYSPYQKPVIADGLSCVVIDGRLRTIDAAAFEFLLGFARDNELRVRPGRGPGPALAAGSAERRAPEAESEQSN